jgi:hypothetical protein
VSAWSAIFRGPCRHPAPCSWLWRRCCDAGRAGPSATPRFVNAGPTDALMIQWTDVKGQLSGSADDATEDTSQAAGVRSVHSSFTGVRTGGHVSLTFQGGLGSVTTLSGDITDGRLSVQLPQDDGSIATVVLSPGSVQDYNQAHASQTAAAEASASAAAASAVADADLTLGRALQSLSADVSTLQRSLDFNQPLADIATALALVQKDYRTEQADAAAVPVDCGQVGSDDGQVGSDVGEVESAQASLESAFSSEDVAASSVRDDVTTVETDLRQLTAALAAAPSVPAQHEAAEVSTAGAAARVALTRAAGAVSAARVRADSLVAKAQTIGGRADALSQQCQG